MATGTRSMRRRRWTGPVAAGWIAAIVLVWLAWLVEIPAAARRVRSAHVMCSDLPDFSGLAGALPAGEPVPFVSGRGSFRDASQAHFCAQYALAPVPLHFRRREEILAAPMLPPVLLLDLGEVDGDGNLLAALRRRARVLGAELDARPGPRGVWIARLRSG